MKNSLANLFGGLRQGFFSREFRIGAPAWPAGTQARLARALQALEQEGGGAGPEAAAFLKEQLRLLADIGTGLWRIRNNMLDKTTSKPREEMRRPYRHLDSVWQALTQAGVVIREHTGENVPSGGIYALKVIQYQPAPGLQQDKVLETIKPSIYYKDRMIQMGEVIVGQPEKSSKE